jgi:7-keto-8-aminopelargonate synthetase-like enzyme
MCPGYIQKADNRDYGNCGSRAAATGKDPTPQGTERLRITPGPLHTDNDIAYLVEALTSFWQRCAIARAVA